MILESAGIIDLFDVVVDGIDAEALALPGKPDPAIFVTAAVCSASPPLGRRLSKTPWPASRQAAGETSASLLGVDRVSQADELREHGADLVVQDLAELKLPPTPSDERQ